MIDQFENEPAGLWERFVFWLNLKISDNRKKEFEEALRYAEARVENYETLIRRVEDSYELYFIENEVLD